MAGSLVYLDASAIVKLVVAEPETAALRRFLASHPERVSSRIAEVEVLRAVRRVRPRSVGVAERVLERIGLIEVDAGIAGAASRLGPPALRTLDALHLATARSLGEDLGVIVAYDARLAEAVRLAGLPLAAPVDD